MANILTADLDLLMKRDDEDEEWSDDECGYQALTLSVQRFDCVGQIIRRACRLAIVKNKAVKFVFNGVAMRVRPIDEAAEVLSRYRREYEIAMQKSEARSQNERGDGKAAA